MLPLLGREPPVYPMGDLNGHAARSTSTRCAHQGKKETLMANNPQQKVFEDPLHEKEIFASEVVGVAFVHGNVIITLANARIEGAGEGKPARIRHVISSRIALTNVGASQLLQNLQGLATQIEAAAAALKGKPH